MKQHKSVSRYKNRMCIFIALLGCCRPSGRMSLRSDFRLPASVLPIQTGVATSQTKIIPELPSSGDDGLSPFLKVDQNRSKATTPHNARAHLASQLRSRLRSHWCRMSCGSRASPGQILHLAVGFARPVLDSAARLAF